VVSLGLGSRQAFYPSTLAVSQLRGGADVLGCNPFCGLCGRENGSFIVMSCICVFDFSIDKARTIPGLVDPLKEGMVASSFRRMPESMLLNYWIPACAGMTVTAMNRNC
jgi:hypothetical protein